MKIFKVRKKGKTRGRPSKQGKKVEVFMNWMYEQHKSEIDNEVKRRIKNIVLYGTED